MQFHIFRCQKDPDYFVVTDADHVDDVVRMTNLCIAPGDKLDKVGVFYEMGKERAAFDERLAKRSIEQQGYYRFEARTFDPVAERPISMP